MTIDYSTPKREKLKKDYKDIPIEDRFFPIERTIDRYLKPLDPANSCLPLIKVRSEVFYQISGAYRLIYEYYCLEECKQEAFGYLYLYAASILKAYELSCDEVKVSGKNPAIQRAIDLGFDLNSVVYALISINEFEIDARTALLLFLSCISSSRASKAIRLLRTATASAS